MLLTRTFALLALALPVVAFVACSGDEAAPSDAPSLVDTPVTSGKSKLPPSSMTTETSATSPKEETTTATKEADDAGTTTVTPKADAAPPPAGLDPDDCPTQQGAECLQCCLRTGGGGIDLPSCLQNCVQ